MLKRPAPSLSARLIGASLITFAAAAIALAAWAAQRAQVHSAETSPPRAVITNPDWQNKPTGAEVAHLYPVEAQKQERTGTALLRCEVTPSGKLADCSVLSESPAGLNFGAAALKMADSFTMTPPAGGASATVNIPIKFDLN